ncbi:type II secretion system F family protein [Lawsonibacter sp. OA9]|uniref:type II secretion system F family protein n=1 Tax=Oscillospiraceae TaxID=216572 RepID=UPI001F055320|nr:MULTISPECIES: type II secretion system F family protein [Oscillospiraceae]MCH1978286.1 type II secretion system F family protein [Lawsonibacter sp. OA9]MCH1981836.1 type II secretion system F family protein [Ruminococcus sp. OA3]
MSETNRIKKLNTAELITFFRQMSYTLQAGISPAEGLAIMAEDTASEQSGQIFTLFQKNLDESGSFCRALKESGLFPAYAIHMLQIGEYAGCLDETTASLADYYEREEATRQSLKNAVTYPCVMIIIMLAVSGILVAKVLPVFQEVYHQLGSELTGIPLRLMTLGNVISRFGFPLILLLIILCCVYAVLISRGRATLPFSKKLYRDIHAARFAHSFSLLLRSGMGTDECLEMIYALTDHEPMKQKIQHCMQLASDGMEFTSALKESHIFSSMEAHMISVGFRSGVPDTVMKQLADTYQQRADERLGRMIAVLEPALVGMLSIIVGFILLSVMLPLIGVLSGINTY